MYQTCMALLNREIERGLVEKRTERGEDPERIRGVRKVILCIDSWNALQNSFC